MSDDRSRDINPFDPKLTQPRDAVLPPSDEPTVAAPSAGEKPTTVSQGDSAPTTVSQSDSAPTTVSQGDSAPTTVQASANDGWTTVSPSTPSAAASPQAPAAPPPPPLSPAEQSPFGLANQPPPPAWPAAMAGAPIAVKQSLSNRALAVLILAITSFVICPIIPAIAALVMAGGADREIDESRGQLTGRGMVTAGRILAWVNLALVVVLSVVLIGSLLWALSLGIDDSIQPDPPRVDV